MRHGDRAHWVLALYLLVYGTAITASLLATHRVGLALIHAGLLMIGALALRTILPAFVGRDRL